MKRHNSVEKYIACTRHAVRCCLRGWKLKRETKERERQGESEGVKERERDRVRVYVYIRVCYVTAEDLSNIFHFSDAQPTPASKLLAEISTLLLLLRGV